MFERTIQGSVDVIQGDSPLTVDHIRAVTGLLQECLGKGQPQVVFDLTSVPLIDSAGLELLLDFQEAFQQVGGVLKLASPNPLCKELLILSGISGKFEIFREALSGVGSFAQ